MTREEFSPNGVLRQVAIDIAVIKEQVGSLREGQGRLEDHINKATDLAESAKSAANSAVFEIKAVKQELADQRLRNRWLIGTIVAATAAVGTVGFLLKG